MKLAEFRGAIEANPGCSLRFAHSDGALADHFHVTEVGRVEKRFIDCGGAHRTEVRCVLQTLVAGDYDHRLDSTKLAKIVGFSDRLEVPADAEVEVEHQERSVSVDTVESVTRDGDTLVVTLRPKQTACLAEDACGITPVAVGDDPLRVIDAGSCSGQGCC